METYILNLRQIGGIPFEDAYHLADQLRERYALDKPFLVQYYIWMTHIVTEGDFGIYSAIRQYSFFDYVFTFLGFVGLSFPAFENAPWSLASCGTC